MNTKIASRCKKRLFPASWVGFIVLFLLFIYPDGHVTGAPDEVRITRISCMSTEGTRHSLVAPNANSGTRPPVAKHEEISILETNREGLYGIGSCDPGRENEKDLAKKLIGKNLSDLFDIQNETIQGYHEKDLLYQLRGLDMAVLDLAGKVLGKPVAELFGPRQRSSVSAYDSTLYMEDLVEEKDLNGYPFRAETPMGRLAKKAKWVVNQRGIRILKVKVGRLAQMSDDREGFKRDIEAVKTIREAVGPDVRIFVDGNRGYRHHTNWVVDFAKAVSKYDVFAMEEMIPEDPERYRNIQKALNEVGISMQITDGETVSHYNRDWARTYLKTELVDIAQPDCKKFGILGLMRWARLAEKYDKQLVAHNFGTKVGVVGSVHVALAVSNSPMIETDDSTFPQFSIPGIELEEGKFHLTGEPGLGITLKKTLRHPDQNDTIWTVGE